MCSVSTQWACTMTSCAILCTFHSWTSKLLCICLSESTRNINIKFTCLKDRMTSVGFKPAILHIQCLNKGIDRHSQDAPQITHSTSHATQGIAVRWGGFWPCDLLCRSTPVPQYIPTWVSIREIHWLFLVRAERMERSCHQTFSCSLWHKDAKLNTKVSPRPFLYFMSILHHENSPMV